VKLSSATLKRAAEIQEQIERLESKRDQLLEGNEASAHAEARPAAAVAETPRLTRRRGPRGRPTRSAALNGRGRGRRSSSPSGPLAPAVVRVLKSRGGAMGVSAILDGLLSSGYKFNSPEPKKNLFARIYRLKGVKQVGPGKFTAE
jgi:hypothetical protein